MMSSNRILRVRLLLPCASARHKLPLSHGKCFSIVAYISVLYYPFISTSTSISIYISKIYLRKRNSSSLLTKFTSNFSQPFCLSIVEQSTCHYDFIRFAWFSWQELNECPNNNCSTHNKWMTIHIYIQSMYINIYRKICLLFLQKTISRGQKCFYFLFDKGK